MKTQKRKDSAKSAKAAIENAATENTTITTKKMVKLADFVENPDNPSVATDEEIARLAGKLKRVPLGLTAMRIAYVTDRTDGDLTGRKVVISGNKRLRCLKAAFGEDGECPAEWFADVTAMSEAERHEFIVSANVSDGSWDLDKLLAQYDRAELGELMGAEAVDALLAEVDRMPQMSVVDGNGEADEGEDEYKEFTDKFKAKHTTDDCYTPPNIYEAVMKWACKHYGFKPRDIVRPFKPNGDYQSEKYAKNAVVLDNPPFSILTEICNWYQDRGIKFFLFAPALTPFASSGSFNTLICGVSIVYANGAKVATSFITNMGDYLIETAPDLFDTLKEINRENEHKITRDLPKYKYPDCVVTAAAINYLNVHHTDFKLKREDAVFICCLDEQKKVGSGLFGGGFLLSERAAAERAAAERAAADRAAAERAAAHEWKLSERELEIQRSIGK